MISVIIPAKNEEKNIGRCIDAITAQTRQPIEYIVVDNGSTDRTIGVAKGKNAKLIILPVASIGELRNAGAKAAKGEILAFLDADCEPDKNWLFFAEKALYENDSIGIVGNNVLPSGSDNWVETVWFANIDRPSGEVRYIGSANLIIRSHLFKAIRGFSKELTTGEDEDLSWKVQTLGFKTIQDKRIKVIHHGYPKTLKDFYKREFWHGSSILNDFMNFKKSRMAFLLSSITLIIISMFVSLFIGEFSVFLLFLQILFYIPVLIAFLKCLKKKKIQIFFPLIILYIVYLTARTGAFLRAIFRRIIA